MPRQAPANRLFVIACSGRLQHGQLSNVGYLGQFDSATNVVTNTAIFYRIPAGFVTVFSRSPGQRGRESSAHSEEETLLEFCDAFNQFLVRLLAGLDSGNSYWPA